MTKQVIIQADPARYFSQPSLPQHRLYEALRAYFMDHENAATVAARFGYQPASLYVLANRWKTGQMIPFFSPQRPGPKSQPKKDAVRDQVFDLRKKNHSVYDIHRLLKEQAHPLSVRAIWEILKEAGFARLPRRLDEERPKDTLVPIPAAMADRKAFGLSPSKSFKTQAGGLFLFLPFLVDLGIAQIIQKVDYPGTAAIPALQYFLSLLSLKLLGRERISHVMDLVHDPGAALWCGLNVLPKTTALTTYSYRIQRAKNLAFLKLWTSALTGTDPVVLS